MKTRGKQTAQRRRRLWSAPILITTLICGCDTSDVAPTEPVQQSDEGPSPDAASGAGGTSSEAQYRPGKEAEMAAESAPPDSEAAGAASRGSGTAPPAADSPNPAEDQSDAGTAGPGAAQSPGDVTSPNEAEQVADAAALSEPSPAVDSGSEELVPEEAVPLIADAAPATPPVAPEPAASYPAGPYGDNNPMVGSIIENLSWRGLLNLDAAAPSAGLETQVISLAGFRGQGHTHLLITTAAGWCGSCRTAANELGQVLETRVKALNGRGGAVVTLLLEGLGSEAPTDNELTAWATAAELEVSVVGPADERTRVVFPQREWAYILNLETMEVVWRQRVELYATPTVSEVGVTQMEALLPSP